ncbi:MAG: hypothetical protein V4469_01825 [Patescibacteria group bacterium]
MDYIPVAKKIMREIVRVKKNTQSIEIEIGPGLEILGTVVGMDEPIDIASTHDHLMDHQLEELVRLIFELLTNDTPFVTQILVTEKICRRKWGKKQS